MKLPQIIIAPIALLLLLGIALFPTIHSNLLIEYLCGPASPGERIEDFYGEFDVEIYNSENSQYYAYKLDDFGNSDGKDRYLVIHYFGTHSDETRIEFLTYEGTDWIEEVTRK